MISGIALIPDEETVQALTRFQAEHGTEWGVPSFERTPPHVSILQCPFQEGALDGVLEELAPLVAGRTARMESLVAKEPDWLFALLDDVRWLHTAQAHAMELLQGTVRHDSKPPRTQGYTPDELQAQKAWSYRYAGSAFLPHITVGAFPSDSVARSALEAWDAADLPTLVGFERLVTYQAGPRGALAGVIEAIEL